MSAYAPYLEFEDFGIEKGSRVSFITRGGSLRTEVVSDLVINEETGEVRITCASSEDHLW